MSHYSIWTNDESSYRVQCFKSALTFRKNENWVWVDDEKLGNWWVLDGTILTDDVLQKYMSSTEKPKIIVIDAIKTTLPKEWIAMTFPLSIKIIFSALEKEAKSISDIKDAPWHRYAFRLKAWPNIAKYGTQTGLLLACSRLLTGNHDFHTVLSWGVPEKILDVMLRDAHRSSLLVLQDKTTPSPKENTPPQASSVKVANSLPQKSTPPVHNAQMEKAEQKKEKSTTKDDLSFIQKLLRRFL